MKKYILLLVILVSGIYSATAQDLGDYKYIVVPQKFEFQDEASQYDLNALSRFLFIKWGFDAYLENEELPSDLNESGCNTLYTRAAVSGFLSTKARISLVDCRGKEVFVLPEGKSKIKTYKEGHQDAFREAFAGLEELGYTYSEEIVTKAEISEEMDVAEEKGQLVPEIRKTQAVKENIPAVVEVSARAKNSEMTIKEEVITEIDNTETSDADQNEAIIEEDINTALSSEDGTYTMKKTLTGFDVYEGHSKIGTATKTSAGSYLVNTSEFTGVGFYNDSEFTVEREIKGVSGLVKMIFTKQ